MHYICYQSTSISNANDDQHERQAQPWLENDQHELCYLWRSHPRWTISINSITLLSQVRQDFCSINDSNNCLIRRRLRLLQLSIKGNQCFQCKTEHIKQAFVKISWIYFPKNGLLNSSKKVWKIGLGFQKDRSETYIWMDDVRASMWRYNIYNLDCNVPLMKSKKG